MGGGVARWLVALGSVAAAVGLTLVGMGMSTLRPDQGLVTLGVILMIGGLVALVVGLIGDRIAGRPNEPNR